MENQITIQLLANSYFWTFITMIILMIVMLFSEKTRDELNRVREFKIQNGTLRLVSNLNWILIFLFILSIKLK